jgi:hypothetical protein
MKESSLKKISGGIPTIFDIALKIVKIDGRFPTIYSKSVKMGQIVLDSRKNSAYFPPNQALLRSLTGKSPVIFTTH